MAKPKTIHTLESLKARATEEGDCLLWNDFAANGVPMVYENGAMVPVRKILLRLVGIPQTARYLCPKCDNPACIEPKHIVQRTDSTHARRMSKESHTTHAAKRRAGVIVWRRQNPLKLDMDKARAIRADGRGRVQVAADYGICPSMVSKIKLGTAWKDYSNPFASLMASTAASTSLLANQRVNA